MPHDLVSAVGHAIVINSWYECYDNKDIPPKWMWPFDEELKDWFEEVKKNRNSGSVDTLEDAPDMTLNEYAADYR